MDEILIRGGKCIKGKIEISGAKNAALPALAASILLPGKITLQNIPMVKDIRVMCQLLSQMGAAVEPNQNSIEIDSSGLRNFEAPYDLVRTMRASVLLIGPLLARLGRARVSMPGGCAIGLRPIDIHLKAFAQLGAEIRIEHGMMDIIAEKMTGCDLYLDFPTVTGTENIMMAALGAEGETTIYNAAREPEVADLAGLLKTMGYRIEGAGTDTIRILPAGKISSCKYKIISDRVEAGTYAVAAAITEGDCLISNVEPEHLTALLAKLGQTGVEVEVQANGIRIQGGASIRPVNVQTAVYPGYPTDLQAQMMALLCLADGESLVTENIYENRFMHVAELNRMGANISVKGSNAIVKGVQRLLGAEVMATDLRASASLVLAGLAAKGETRIFRIYHLDRGYQNLVEKLREAGADIERVQGRGP
jgi:UDP-N-acetylglucosamine 1-carboxyvinyltransferase